MCIFKYNEIVNYFSNKSGKNCEFSKDKSNLFLKIGTDLFSIKREFDEKDFYIEKIIKDFELKIEIVKNKDYISSDDFKIVFSDLENTISLHSEKLDKFINIPLEQFVDFLNKNSISKMIPSIENVLFDRNIIIYKNKNLFTEESFYKNYFETPFTYQENLLIGNQYLFLDDIVTYIGERFSSELILDKYIRFDRISKIEKKQYVLLSNSTIVPLTKTLKDYFESISLSSNDCDKLLEKYYKDNVKLTYFSKEDFLDVPVYGFIDFNNSDKSPFIKINESFFTKVQNSNNLKTCSNFNLTDSFKDYVFEFKLDLCGKSFNSVEATPLNLTGKEDILLQRIGILNK